MSNLSWNWRLAGLPPRNVRRPGLGWILSLRNQKTRNHKKDFMVSGLPYGIVLGRAFAPLRLCVKRLLPGGPAAKTDDGAKSRHHRNAGPGPSAAGIQRQGAKPPRRNRIFFMTKPGNQEASKRFHGFRASLWNCFGSRLCVFASLR